MDPLSHALIGGLTAQTERTSSRRFWIMCALGMVPDVDVLANGLGAWAAPLQHRGLTHSLLGVVVMSFLFSFLFRSWDEGPFWRRSVHYSFPLLAHLGGDFLTAFGVPFFAPFSYHGYCLGIIGSLNPLIILSVGGGLIWLNFRGRTGLRSPVLIWSFLGFYVLALLAVRSYAETLMPGFTLVPSTVNPFVWQAIQLNPSDHDYHLIRTNVLTGSHQEEKKISAPKENPWVQATLKSPLVQEFLRENRWPVTRVTRRADQWTVEWGTLLFSMRGLVRGKVAVDLSSTGDILSERKIFNFWDPE